MEKISKIKFDLTTKTLIYVLVIFFLISEFSKILYVAILIFIAFTITSAIDPIVQKLSSRRLPRSIAVLIVYVIISLLLFTGIFFFTTSIAKEFNQFLRVIPQIPDRIVSQYPSFAPLLNNSGVSDTFSHISRETRAGIYNFGNNASGIFSTTVGILKSFTTFIALIALSIYMLIDKDKNIKLVERFIPPKKRKYFEKSFMKVEFQLGAWLRGQFILSLLLTAIYYIVLHILNIPFSFTLAVLAGFFELIPVAGPIITGVIVSIATLAFNPSKFIIMVILALLIHEFEAHVLVPKIMEKVLGISPLITIIALLLGTELLGFVGAVIAVPVAAVIQLILENYIYLSND